MRTPRQAHEQSQNHPCTTCRATPGQRCTQADGQPAQWPHSPRLALVDGDVAWPAMSRAQYERHRYDSDNLPVPEFRCPACHAVTRATMADPAPPPRTGPALTTRFFDEPDPGQRYRLSGRAIQAIAAALQDVYKNAVNATQPLAGFPDLVIAADGVTLDLWQPPATTTPTTPQPAGTGPRSSAPDPSTATPHAATTPTAPSPPAHPAAPTAGTSATGPTAPPSEAPSIRNVIEAKEPDEATATAHGPALGPILNRYLNPDGRQ